MVKGFFFAIGVIAAVATCLGVDASTLGMCR
jgi:hypothetical protein